MRCMSHMVATIAALAVGAAVCGCTVIDTIPVVELDGSACHSAGGAYYLPKGLLHLKVKNAAAPQLGFMIDDTDPTVVPSSDRRQLFCLDYLTSPTSDDIIAVERDENTGTLKTVASDVTDRTPQIAQTLVNTAENLAIAGARGALLTAAPGDTVDLQFDPFDLVELRTVNHSLRSFGFCLYIEGHSFSPDQITPERWCDSPRQDSFANPNDMIFKALPIPPAASKSGILYRPALTYRLIIYRKSDPQRDRWTLFKTKTIEMPNIAPVLSIGVERAMFARRATLLTFTGGVLTGVQIHKTSELVGFVSIPLQVAQAIVDIPAQIIKIRISDVNQSAELIQTQSQLIDAVNSYNTTLATLVQSGGTVPPAANRGAFLGGCTDVGIKPSDCATLLRGNQ